VGPNKTRDTVSELHAEGDDAAAASSVVSAPSGAPSRFVLERRGGRISLRPGSILLGRSNDCQLVLDDSLVSRKHALLVVKTDEVRIKDLGSANGVYVNGARIQDSVQLRAGDRVVIGQEEMVLQVSSFSVQEPASRSRRMLAETLHGDPAQVLVQTSPSSPVPSVRADDSEATQHGQALDLLGGVAEKVLALGRGEEAERILSNSLQTLLQKAKEADGIELEAAEKAAHYATKLAAATGKGRWIDYSIELFALQKRPLPGAVIDQLYAILRNTSGVSLSLFREYVETLHAAQGRFGPNDRFLAHRIEGLERLVK
jgi:pSer/pThr/pTyr-binding forkhead associated (FHA) protein